MLGLLRDVGFVLALLAALCAVAWTSNPKLENYLHSAATCHEVLERLALKQYRDLTPAEGTDMANCD